MVGARDWTVKAGMRETLPSIFKLPSTSGCGVVLPRTRAKSSGSKYHLRDTVTLYCVQGVSLIKLGDVRLLLHAKQLR